MKAGSEWVLSGVGVGRFCFFLEGEMVVQVVVILSVAVDKVVD